MYVEGREEEERDARTPRDAFIGAGEGITCVI
jgi:hypothetical protein